MELLIGIYQITNNVDRKRNNMITKCQEVCCLILDTILYSFYFSIQNMLMVIFLTDIPMSSFGNGAQF